MKSVRNGIALLWLLLLAGCASGVLVGGGRGGEEAASYGTEADAGITHEVNRRLVRDPLVRAMDVEVITREGVVTLSGKVPTEAAVERASRVARSVPGVKSVRNRLRVEP